MRACTWRKGVWKIIHEKNDRPEKHRGICSSSRRRALTERRRKSSCPFFILFDLSLQLPLLLLELKNTDPTVSTRWFFFFVAIIRFSRFSYFSVVWCKNRKIYHWKVQNLSKRDENMAFRIDASCSIMKICWKITHRLHWISKKSQLKKIPLRYSRVETCLIYIHHGTSWYK